MLWIHTITECRVARGYRISLGGKHICSIGYTCGKILLVDQHIYHLKTVGRKILFMLLYFKIFFQRNREECHIFNSLPFFFNIWAPLKQPCFDNQFAGQSILAALLLQSIFPPLHKGTTGNYKQSPHRRCRLYSSLYEGPWENTARPNF